MSRLAFFSECDLSHHDSAVRGDLDYVIVAAAGAAVCAELHDLSISIELQIDADRCYALIDDCGIERIGDSMRRSAMYAAHQTPHDGPPRLVHWLGDTQYPTEYEYVQEDDWWTDVASIAREIVNDLICRLHAEHRRLHVASLRVRAIERAAEEMQAVRQLAGAGIARGTA